MGKPVPSMAVNRGPKMHQGTERTPSDLGRCYGKHCAACKPKAPKAPKSHIDHTVPEDEFSRAECQGPSVPFNECRCNLAYRGARRKAGW